MSSVKAIAIAAVTIVSIVSIVIITTRSNNMILLPGYRSSNNNNNDNKQNMTASPESKPSLSSASSSTHVDTRYVKEFYMPNGTWPNGILVAKNGIVWTVGTKSNVLISFDPNQGRIRSSYPIPEGSEKATIADYRDNLPHPVCIKVSAWLPY